MKYTPIIFFSLLLLTASCKKKEQTADGQVPPIEVAVPAEDSIVLHQTYPGLVQANGKVQVVSRVNGKLLQQCFQDGDHVRAGQVLYRIESTQYANAVREAEAALATARSQAAYYRTQHAAMQRALQADAVAKINVIQAESNLRQAEAAIKNAQATLSDARTNLSYCTVTAPISGTVAASDVNTGSILTVGTQLCNIVDNTQLKVVFNIDEAQYQHLLTSGQGTSGPLFSDVPLSFSGLEGNYTADLYYTSPSVNTSTGQMMLEGNISDPSGRIRDGMYVTVDLPTGVNPHALLVKDASIGTQQTVKYLYVVTDSNTVAFAPVQPGPLYQDSLRVVNSGLRPGQRYVTKALLQVRPGMKIKPVMTR